MNNKKAYDMSSERTMKSMELADKICEVLCDHEGKTGVIAMGLAIGHFISQEGAPSRDVVFDVLNSTVDVLLTPHNIEVMRRFDNEVQK